MNVKAALKRLFGQRPSEEASVAAPPLFTVEHGPIDKMRFEMSVGQLPRFTRICRDDAPSVAPDTQEPAPLDFTEASPDEVIAWQQEVHAAREARASAKPYSLWEDLCRDVYYMYHRRQSPQLLPEAEIDPRVQLHRRIVDKMLPLEDVQRARETTRNDQTMAAAATMRAAEDHLRHLIEHELAEQVQQAEKAAEQMRQAQEAEQELSELRQEAAAAMEAGQPVPDNVRQEIKALAAAKHGAMDKAEEIMAEPTPMSGDAYERIGEMAKAARESSDRLAGAPHFGQGFGEDEPIYESPEQALELAELWSREPLRSIARAYGQFDPDMRYERANRVVGGQDEIVDVEMSDNLKRAIPSELARLAMDEEVWLDDFVMRLLAGELTTFQTVGEEHTGRGPTGLVIDESGSTSGAPFAFEKGAALAVLNMMRREKRDAFVVSFAAKNEVASWFFPANRPLDGAAIIDMARHFFNGRATHPLAGLAEAERIIRTVPKFEKADIVLMTDGECPYKDEDAKLRQRLIETGVRLHGVGVGGQFGYLKRWVSADRFLTHVMNFALDQPNDATKHLATTIA